MASFKINISMKVGNAVKMTGTAAALAMLLSGCALDGTGLDAAVDLSPSRPTPMIDRDHEAAPSERQGEAEGRHDNGRHNGEREHRKDEEGDANRQQQENNDENNNEDEDHGHRKGGREHHRDDY